MVTPEKDGAMRDVLHFQPFRLLRSRVLEQVRFQAFKFSKQKIGHLFPYQYTMDEAATTLVEETEKYFALDEGILLTDSSLRKYG